MFGYFFDVGFSFIADHPDRYVDKITHHRLDIASDITNFGKLGSFDFDEWCTGEAREASRNFGFADAGRTDQYDVVRHDLLAEILFDALPPPAITQRNRDCTLRCFLTDDVLVELTDDLTWRQLFQPIAFRLRCFWCVRYQL